MTDLSGRTALVVSVSNRAAAGVYEDTTGPRIVAGLQQWGCAEVRAIVVPDGDPVRDALRRAVTDRCDIVITTGGTGVTPTDRTPEMTRDVLDREIPGIAEAIRAYGVGKGIGTAALSRGLAGQAEARPRAPAPRSRPAASRRSCVARRTRRPNPAGCCRGPAALCGRSCR